MYKCPLCDESFVEEAFLGHLDECEEKLPKKDCSDSTKVSAEGTSDDLLEQLLAEVRTRGELENDLEEKIRQAIQRSLKQPTSELLEMLCAALLAPAPRALSLLRAIGCDLGHALVPLLEAFVGYDEKLEDEGCDMFRKALSLLQEVCVQCPTRDSSLLVMELVSFFPPGPSERSELVLHSIVRLLKIVIERSKQLSKSNLQKGTKRQQWLYQTLQLLLGYLAEEESYFSSDGKTKTDYCSSYNSFLNEVRCPLCSSVW